jgi:hypothetical protein
MSDDGYFGKDWKYVISDEGVIRDNQGSTFGDNTGSPSENRRWVQVEGAMEAPTPEDVEAYEDLRYGDVDFEAVREEMARLAAHVDPADAAKINRNHRTFVENFHEVKNLMVGAQVDAPRHRAIAELREQLAGEGANSGKRRELERRILSLHGPGR